MTVQVTTQKIKEHKDKVSTLSHEKLTQVGAQGTYLHADQSPGVAKSNHLVQFYESDAYLLASVKKFIEAGDAAVVIATPVHRNMLEKDLHSKKYESYDAEETLARFMVGDLPDRERFMQVIGKVIANLSTGNKKVHAFGEMVALLHEKGNTQGALLLEALWNELQDTYNFSLFCAYPMHAFADESHHNGFTRVCDTHGVVTPSESYTALSTDEDRQREIAMLQQKAAALEAEVQKSCKLERQKDDFLAVASHELKTPVTSIKAYGQMLEREFIERGETKAAVLVSKMDMQVDKLSKLIDDLLDVSKIQFGQMTFTETSFDSNVLIAEMVEEMQMVSPRHVIYTEFLETVLLYADRDRIGQVLTNLLSNAIKYSPDTAHILVSTEYGNQNLTVHIKDFGIGIEKKYQEKVFDRFYRAHEGILETYPGLGLGLYISREIVQRQHGKLWLESTAGYGSTFSFSLPVLVRETK